MTTGNKQAKDTDKAVSLSEVLRLVEAAAQSVGEPATGKFIADKLRDCLG